MKALAVFLSGLATTVAGVFTRSCNEGASLLTTSWCGGHPPALAAYHEHCAGCVMIAAGIGLLALSPLLVSRSSRQPKRVRS